MKDFELLPHTADIKIRVYGTSQAELFLHALQGMFQCIGPQAPGCTVHNERLICPELPKSHAVSVTAPDMDALLVNFLSDCWYLADVHNEAYLDARFSQIDATTLQATIFGVSVTGFERVEIKAVTYHDLHITVRDDLWQTEIVFDI